jgi:hypothetical protein
MPAMSGASDRFLDALAPDEVLGELSAIDGQPRSASVTAVDPVDALVIPTQRRAITVLDMEALRKRAYFPAK